ncbi:glycoside hydrolase N-terminal domain-containing protein [Arthrobacter sp. D1-29]
MSVRHRVLLNRPATLFINSFLLGNGSTGAAVYGTPARERFELNADTLWSGGPLPEPSIDGGAERLAAVREAIQRGDHLGADAAAVALQGNSWTQSYQPVGGLLWTYGKERTGEYRRFLDVSEAIATTEYETGGGWVRLDSFVSAPDGVLVSTATGPDAGSILGSLDFDGPHPHARVERRVENGTEFLFVSGRAPASVLPNYVQDPAPVVYADDEPDDQGLVDAGMGFALVASVERTDDGTLRLIAATETGFRGYDQRPSADVASLLRRAEGRVRGAQVRTTEDLRRRHTTDYQSYFNRIDLDLTASGGVGAAEASSAELYFHFGRYLLISSSRPGTAPANLQGIWNADVRPGWSANYTTNINAQMNYWGAEVTALQDLHQPLLALTRDLAKKGAETARAFYGVKGSVVHHNTDIWRFTAPVSGEPQWANWPSGLMWLAAHLWDRTDFADASPVADKATIAALEPIVVFALEMLQDNGAGGLAFSPSTSPENLFHTGGATASVTSGSAMDQELVHELLSHYLSLAETCSAADIAIVDRARLALPRILPVRTGADGAILEWGDESLEPVEPGHRHLSHLYGLCPGTRITEAGTPEDFAAVRRALDTRLAHGSGHTGWSQAWVLCLAARLRDRQLAERSISTLVHHLSSESLLDLHPSADWPGGNIFQIDGNLGAIAGLAELLVQSHEGPISLLKTVPTAWTAGRVSGIRARGGHTVDVEWAEGALLHASVRPSWDNEVWIEVPHGQDLTVLDDDGGQVPASRRPAIAGRTGLSWTAAAGRSYLISPVGSHSGNQPQD